MWNVFLLSVFFLSVAAYKLPDDIYAPWFKFARWWVPLSMFLILISPQYSTNFMDPIEKGSVAFAMSAIFLVASIGIIVVKYFATRKKVN